MKTSKKSGFHKQANPPSSGTGKGQGPISRAYAWITNAGATFGSCDSGGTAS